MTCKSYYYEVVTIQLSCSHFVHLLGGPELPALLLLSLVPSNPSPHAIIIISVVIMILNITTQYYYNNGNSNIE